MRNLRYELLSVATVLSVPTVLVISFPFDALTFRASSAPSECVSSAAFVTLTAEQEAAALVAAKTAWQSDAASRQRMRIRMPLGELPEDRPRPLLATDSACRAADAPVPFAYPPGGWEPSLREASPVRLEAEPKAPAPPAFSREELLKLN